MINKEKGLKIFSEIGFPISEEKIIKLDKYAELLIEWNEKINLTSIKDADGVLIKHFIDSLWLLKELPEIENASLIDVGTGAGFPSLPCKIYNNKIKLTMLDSLRKRIDFLKTISNELEVKTECIHSRAEDLGKDSRHREKYDFATARAVAKLYELCEYCLPFVKVGGKFVALKGFEIEEELDEAKKAIKILGGEIEKVIKYSLPDEENSKRSMIIIKKISQTPTKYPRMSAKMKKQPLI